MNEVAKRFLKLGLLLHPSVADKIGDADPAKLKPKDGIVVTEIEMPPPIPIPPKIKAPVLEIPKKPALLVKELGKKKDALKVEQLVDYYNKRFEFLRGLIVKKMDQSSLVSIKNAAPGTKVGIVGMVKDATDKIVIEDSTSHVAVTTKDKLSQDEVVGVVGTVGKDSIEAQQILYPDVPLGREIVFSEGKIKFRWDAVADEEYVVAANGKPSERVAIISGPMEITAGSVKVLGYKPDVSYLQRHGGEFKKAAVAALRRRHLDTQAIYEGDSLLLRELPDIIFMPMGVTDFVNYKGVTVVSVGPGGMVELDLKTRECKIG